MGLNIFKSHQTPDIEIGQRILFKKQLVSGRFTGKLFLEERIHEGTIREISPSGTHIRISVDIVDIWLNRKEFKIVEVLKRDDSRNENISPTLKNIVSKSKLR